MYRRHYNVIYFRSVRPRDDAMTTTQKHPKIQGPEPITRMDENIPPYLQTIPLWECLTPFLSNIPEPKVQVCSTARVHIVIPESRQMRS